MLAVVRFDGRDRLIVRPLEGGPERIVVDEPGQLAIAFPRFAPDGGWIAFTAAGELPPLPEGGAHRPFGLDGMAAIFGTRTALAHGAPWEIWVVRPDGSDLRRVTSFEDDDASVTWSPDGVWLATLSAEAIHIVSQDGSSPYCVSNQGGYGALEWLP